MRARLPGFIQPLVLLACAGLTSAAFAQRPPAFVPAQGDSVLERLPSGYAELAVSAHRSARVGRPSELAQALRLLELAARTGDARLAARADALLARQVRTTPGDPSLRMARAFSAQHRHDFDSALRELDALIATAPRHADARLSRAQIHLVRGHLAAARRDCIALATGIDQDNGLLCVGMLAMRQGQYTTAARVLDRWLQQDGITPPRRAHALLMRAEVAARARDRHADMHFRRALSASPGDVRVLLPYARHLRNTGRASLVEALLASHPDHDGLQLQRALAAQEAGAASATALRRAQARRYAAARALGRPPEARDEAEFLLVLERDTSAALAAAQRNFQTQRDREDADLLDRAAQAAGRKDLQWSLRRWSRAQAIAQEPTR